MARFYIVDNLILKSNTILIDCFIFKARQIYNPTKDGKELKGKIELFCQELKFACFIGIKIV
jgi:hypothetical protein